MFSPEIIPVILTKAKCWLFTFMNPFFNTASHNIAQRFMKSLKMIKLNSIYFKKPTSVQTGLLLISYNQSFLITKVFL